MKVLRTAKHQSTKGSQSIEICSLFSYFERAIFIRLVLSCIEADFSKQIFVGKLAPRSTLCTPSYSSQISKFLQTKSPKCCYIIAKLSRYNRNLLNFAGFKFANLLNLNFSIIAKSCQYSPNSGKIIKNDEKC